MIYISKVKKPPPVCTHTTVFSKLKYLFEYYADGGEGCYIEQEGFNLFLNQVNKEFSFMPSYTSSEELMKEADSHNKGTSP